MMGGLLRIFKTMRNKQLIRPLVTQQYFFCKISQLQSNTPLFSGRQDKSHAVVYF